MRDSLDPLELGSLRTTGRKTIDDQKVFEAEPLMAGGSCPHCGSERVHRHGKDEKRIRDTPFGGMPTVILIRRERFKCPTCDHTFFPSLEPDVDLHHRATNRLVRYIQEQSLNRTFAELSREVGLDEKTVRRIAKSFIAELDRNNDRLPGSTLGIATLNVLSEPRALVAGMTDQGKWGQYAILPSDSERAFGDHLRYLRDRTRIKATVTDLNKRRRRVIHRELPSVAVVLDPAALLKLAFGGLEQTRKRLRARLNSRERSNLVGDKALLEKEQRQLTASEQQRLTDWSRHFPDLITAYHIKERACALFSAPNPQNAKDQMQACLDEIPRTLAIAFEPFMNALATWEEEIINWHHHPTPEPLSEPVNRLGAAIRRMGRGYSFDIIRARILYGRCAQRTTPRGTGRHLAHLSRKSEGLWAYATDAPTDPFSLVLPAPYSTMPDLPLLTTICEELEADFPE